MTIVTDFCEPCPSHGVCYEGKLECDSGYRKQGRSCREDGDINETAMKLVCNNTFFILVFLLHMFIFYFTQLFPNMQLSHDVTAVEIGRNSCL